MIQWSGHSIRWATRQPRNARASPQHRTAGGDTIEGVHTGEAIGAGREAPEEVAQLLLVVVLPQDVEHEVIADLHQGLNRPIRGDGDRNPWWIETGLSHPAGHHGTAAAAASRLSKGTSSTSR